MEIDDCVFLWTTEALCSLVPAVHGWQEPGERDKAPVKGILSRFSGLGLLSEGTTKKSDKRVALSVRNFEKAVRIRKESAHISFRYVSWTKLSNKKSDRKIAFFAVLLETRN